MSGTTLIFTHDMERLVKQYEYAQNRIVDETQLATIRFYSGQITGIEQALEAFGLWETFQAMHKERYGV